MAFTIPPLLDIKPPKWVRNSINFKDRNWVPELIVVTAFLYVGVVILLPAVSVVVQAGLIQSLFHEAWPGAPA